MTTDQRIAAYLEKIPPCVAGQGGDVHLFKVACILYNGWALSMDETLEWLEVFNKTCQPPWSHDRHEYKARSAATAAHDRPRGHLLGGAALPVKSQRDSTPIAKGKLPPRASRTANTIFPTLRIAW